MIDTHIHLDEEAYAADREEMIARQRANGVTAMLVPGVNANSIEGILDVCRRHPGYCYPALGFHPQDITPDWKASWAVIERAIRTHEDELVAIGEIGLDYHYEPTYKAEQHEAFRVQLALAQELDLPVMIHSRDATEDTIRILKDARIKNLKSKIKNSLRGVIHCFNGSKEYGMVSGYRRRADLQELQAVRNAGGGTVGARRIRDRRSVPGTYTAPRRAQRELSDDPCGKPPGGDIRHHAGTDYRPNDR